MKSSFSAVRWEEVYTSLDHSLLHAVCCVHIFTTQYTLNSWTHEKEPESKTAPTPTPDTLTHVKRMCALQMM